MAKPWEKPQAQVPAPSATAPVAGRKPWEKAAEAEAAQLPQATAQPPAAPRSVQRGPDGYFPADTPNAPLGKTWQQHPGGAVLQNAPAYAYLDQDHMLKPEVRAAKAQTMALKQKYDQSIQDKVAQVQAQNDPMLLMLKPEARTPENAQRRNPTLPSPGTPFRPPAKPQPIDPFGQDPIDKAALEKEFYFRENNLSNGPLENIGYELSQFDKTAPLYLWNGAVGATEGTINLPRSITNEMGAASANMEVSPEMAMRNVNRMPQLDERVGQGKREFTPWIPKVDLERAYMNISPEDQSMIGSVVQGFTQFLAARGLTKLPGYAGDAAALGVGFTGDSGRTADMIDPNNIPEGVLRDYVSWLKTQPGDSDFMGRVKNLTEDATINLLLMGIGRGGKALMGGVNPQMTPTNAGAMRPGSLNTGPLEAPTITTQLPTAPYPRPMGSAPDIDLQPPPVTSVPQTPPRPRPVSAATQSPPAAPVPPPQPAGPSVATQTAQAGAPPIPPQPPVAAAASAPNPVPGAGAVPPAGNLVPVPQNEAVAAFRALPPKTREALLRTLQSAGMDKDTNGIWNRIWNGITGRFRNSQEAMEAIRKLGENMPEDRQVMFALELMKTHGGDLETILPAMGRKFATEGARTDQMIGGVDRAREIIDQNVPQHINGQRDYVEGIAADNFGPGVVPAQEALDTELDALSSQYEKLLDTKRSDFGRLRSEKTKAPIVQALANIRSFLTNPQVVHALPDEVKLQVMLQARQDILRLKFTDEQKAIILAGDGAVLAPLFDAYGPLQWSPKLWDHLVDQYPKQAAHSLQSSLRESADAAFRNGDTSLAQYLRSLRGESGKGGLLDMLERALPGKGGKVGAEGGYRWTRQQFGDAKSAESAFSILKRFKEAANSEGDVAAIITELKDLPARQRQAAENQITSLIRQELGRKIDSPKLSELRDPDRLPTPNLTALSSQNFLNALEDVFGQRGRELADGIRLARASTDALTSIHPKYNSRTQLNAEDVKNAGARFEDPSGQEGRVLDEAVGALSGGALVSSAVNPAAATVLGSIAVGKALYNKWKSGKLLSNEERNQLVDFLFRNRKPGDTAPIPRARPFNPGGVAASAGTNAIIGAGIGATGALATDQDPMQGAIIGGIGGGLVGASRKIARGYSTLIPETPRPVQGRTGPRPPVPPVSGPPTSPRITPPGTPPVQAGFFGRKPTQGPKKAPRPISPDAAVAPPSRSIPPGRSVAAPERAMPVEQIDTTGWGPGEFQAARNQLNEMLQDLNKAPAADRAGMEAEIASLKQALGLGEIPPEFRDVSMGGRFKAPVEMPWAAGSAEDAAIKQAIAKKQWTVEAVPAEQITPTQDSVFYDYAKAAQRYAGDDAMPVLVKQGDQYFVADGHHRLMATKGAGPIKARVINLDAPPSPSKPLKGMQPVDKWLGDVRRQTPYETDQVLNSEYKRRKASGNYTVENMPIADITPTQRNVNPDFTAASERYAGDSPDHRLPLVVKYKGVNYLSDGHHRAVAASDAGQRTLKVRVINLDAPPSTSKPPVKNGLGGSKLPMDEASRMERARAQGFDVETPLYHGTDRQFDQFKGVTFLTDNPQAANVWAQGAAEDSVSQSQWFKKRQRYVNDLFKNDDPSAVIEQKALLAAMEWNAEGQTIIPVYARLQRPLIVDAAGSDMGRAEVEALVKRAKREGKDGLVIRNARDDNGSDGAIYAVFEPKNVRRTDAAFDPSQSGSSKLLAGMEDNATGYGTAGGMVAGGAFAQDTDGDGVISPQERAMGALGGAITGGVLGKALGYGAGKAQRAMRPVNGIDQAGIKAWHGSPHDFDKFELSDRTIGTGEGAQAYGHGLYFAGNDKVASGYRDALSGMNKPRIGNAAVGSLGDVDYAIMDAGRKASPDLPQKTLDTISTNIVEAIRMGDDPRSAVASLVRSDAEKRAADAMLSVAKDVKPSPAGRLYEVDIDAEHADFLDWDKPLKEQSPKVQEAYNETVRPKLRTREIGNNPNLGKLTDVYLEGGGSLGVFTQDQLADVMQNPAKYSPMQGDTLGRDKAFTDKLREAGIPGIKYLDQGSRGSANVNELRGTVSMLETAARKNPTDAYLAERLNAAKSELRQAESELTHNYVVFDDSRVNIINKSGFGGGPPRQRPTGFGAKPPAPKGPPKSTKPPMKAEEAQLRANLRKARTAETAVRNRTVMRDNRDELRRPAEEAVMQAERDLNEYLDRQFHQAANAARWKDRGASVASAGKKAATATGNVLKRELMKEDAALLKVWGAGTAVGGGALMLGSLMNQGKDKKAPEAIPPTDPRYFMEKVKGDTAKSSTIQNALVALNLLPETDADGHWGTRSSDATKAWLSKKPDRNQKLPLQDYEVPELLAEAYGGYQEGNKWFYNNGEPIVFPLKTEQSGLPSRPLRADEVRRMQYRKRTEASKANQ